MPKTRGCQTPWFVGSSCLCDCVDPLDMTVIITPCAANLTRAASQWVAVGLDKLSLYLNRAGVPCDPASEAKPSSWLRVMYMLQKMWFPKSSLCRLGDLERVERWNLLSVPFLLVSGS